jgi:nucleotidyltransferase substrate binding protein (TIGR01987 family)
MSLDVTSFGNAIHQLEKSLEYALNSVSNPDPYLSIILRSGTIQAFEFTYELAFKLIKRSIIDSGENDISNLSFDEIIRRGYAKELLVAEISTWHNFRKSRGTTIHTHDNRLAQDVFDQIPAFLAEAQYLHKQLLKYAA